MQRWNMDCSLITPSGGVKAPKQRGDPADSITYLTAGGGGDIPSGSTG